LINEVLKKVMDNSPAYNALKTSFEEFGNLIKTETTPEGHSLETIEQEISGEIQEWGTLFACVHRVYSWSHVNSFQAA
jgi:hypothetical protein